MCVHVLICVCLHVCLKVTCELKTEQIKASECLRLCSEEADFTLVTSCKQETQRQMGVCGFLVVAEWPGEDDDEAAGYTQAEGGTAAETSGPLLSFGLRECGIEAGIIRNRAPLIENASANQQYNLLR